MSKVDSIRRLWRCGESVAAIAREVGVTRDTVYKYVRMEDLSPSMPVRGRRPSKMDRWAPVVDQWLEDDRRERRKQRHTAHRVWARLTEELGADVSEATVRRYVRKRKEQMRSERDQFLDLDWAPGVAQADFGEADFRVRGTKVPMSYFVLSFPFSNVGLAQVFPGENAECVCQGLRNIFEYLSAVPTRIVFDNAAGVGRRVCDTVRTTELFGGCAAHYGFDYRFCNPHSGNEKGNVENKVGYDRRNLFVPVPRVWDMDGYNARLLDRCMRMSDKEHYLKGEPESQLFQEDLFAMSGLPEAPYSCVRWARPRADKKGRVRLDGRHWYSTDPSLAGLELIVGLGATTVEVYDPSGSPVCTHPRAYGASPTDTSDPGSQLALLANRPGAWGDSRVRSALPDDLRAYMDSLDGPARKAGIRLLRDRCAESGWDATVSASSAALAATGRIDEASVAAVAARALSGSVEYDEPVDLAEYDAMMGSL